MDEGEHERIDAVFVGHPKDVDFERLELAARAVISGARLLTGSLRCLRRGERSHLEPRSHGDGCHCQGERQILPTIVGKPSRAAVNTIETHLGSARRGDRRDRRRPPLWTSPSATWAARGSCWYAPGSADRSTSAVSQSRRPHVTVQGVSRPARPYLGVSGRECGRVLRTARARRLAAVHALARR